MERNHNFHSGAEKILREFGCGPYSRCGGDHESMLERMNVFQSSEGSRPRERFARLSRQPV